MNTSIFEKRIANLHVNPLKQQKSMLLNFLVLIVIALHFNLTSCNSPQKVKEGNLVLVCGDSKVLIVNRPKNNDSIPLVIWEWDAHLADDLPEIYRTKRFNSIDDCKAINDGRQILVSSSSGAVAIVNRENKKVYFYAEVPNAHSIELLPGNKLVAAASTNKDGNKLMVFDTNQVEKTLFSDSLYSSHGVVWDGKRNSLFALGYNVLREYEFRDEVQLSLKNEWKIPGISGHDLQMAANGNKLFLTERNGAWSFDLNAFRFEKIENFPDTVNIKSINQNKSGQFLFTVAEDNWWAHHVRFFNPSGILVFPDMKVYKARWIKP
jgi:hypothetical protein